MPELDGFELAAMIREHPRFQKTAMIFISAIQVSDIDRLRGYEMGAVDYVPVPVIPEVLRAKIRVFVELYRKTRQLERLNAELEDRVRARTAELEESTARLVESEQRRSMAIAAGKMGSWDWDWVNGDWMWDEGQYQICGVDPQTFRGDIGKYSRACFIPDDAHELRRAFAQFAKGAKSYETEFRLRRPDGEIRWCVGTAAATIDKNGRVVRVSGVTVDITERKRAEERQNLLTREVDHRAKNALALAQSIVRLTRAPGHRAPMFGRSRGASARWRGFTRSFLCRVGRARKSSGWSTRSSRPIPVAGQIKVRRLRDSAGARNGANAGAGLARARDQFRQIWRALGRDRPRVDPMGNTGRGYSHDWSGKKPDGPVVQKPASRGFGTRSVIASIESQLGGQAYSIGAPRA